MTSLTKRVSLAAASAVVLSLTALPTFAADLDLPPSSAAASGTAPDRDGLDRDVRRCAPDGWLP